MESRTAAFLKAVATLLSREPLEEDPEPAPSGKPGFVSWLFAVEELPKAAVSVPPPREGFLSWLFKPDVLPPPEGPAPRHKPSIFAVVFGRDDLSQVPGEDETNRKRDYQEETPSRDGDANSAGER